MLRQHSLSMLLQSKRITEHSDVAKILYTKKGLVHKPTAARPNAVTTFLHSPRSKAYSGIVQATRTGEMDRNALIQLLKKYRAFRRLDLAESAVAAYKEGGRSPSPHHYSLLMAIANDAGVWREALAYWTDAASQNKIRPITHSVLLQTLRVAGKWADAVSHLNTMIADRIPVDSHALHTVMNTARTAAPWTVSIGVFSQCLAHGTKPNAVVYLVLLRCLAKSQLPSRWHYSLSLLSSLTCANTVDVNAGMYNAVIDTLGSCGRWVKATRVYKMMESMQVVPNSETFRALMQVHSQDAPHCVMVLSEAHKFGTPVSESMFRYVFKSLLRLRKADAVVALVESELGRVVVDPGNPHAETGPLLVGLLDALLSHSDYRQILKILDAVEHHIETVVPAASFGLGILGERTQRWVVEGGRIAVVDHTTLQSVAFESLRSHYDHVIIPLSVIRHLIMRMETLEGGTQRAKFYQWVLQWLRDQLHSKAKKGAGSLADFVHVLPLQHELFARSFIAPATMQVEQKEEELSLLRRSASEAAAELMLTDDSSNSSADGAEFAVRASSYGDAMVSTTDAANVVTRDRSPQPLVEPLFSLFETSVTAPEQIVSVAVMLKRLNPDVDVHVVSRSRTVLAVTKKWNVHTETFHKDLPAVVTDVFFTSAELLEKAPPATEPLDTPPPAPSRTTPPIVSDHVILS